MSTSLLTRIQKQVRFNICAQRNNPGTSENAAANQCSVSGRVHPKAARLEQIRCGITSKTLRDARVFRPRISRTSFHCFYALRHISMQRYQMNRNPPKQNANSRTASKKGTLLGTFRAIWNSMCTKRFFQTTFQNPITLNTNTSKQPVRPTEVNAKKTVISFCPSDAMRVHRVRAYETLSPNLPWLPSLGST